MSFDSRLRDDLRRAADAHDLREEVALQHVKATQPTEWADLTVAALEDVVSPRARPVRAQRTVGALAACALLTGAIALPVALSSRHDAVTTTAGSVTRTSSCGPPVAKGYRSTAVVRVAPAPSASPPSTNASNIKLAGPVPFTLGVCNAARDRSHLHSGDHPGIGFDAATNASGDLLSLTATTPTPTGATTLARNWAEVFRTARVAEAKRQIREQQHNLNLQVTQLHNELRSVDAQLVKLAPITYKDLLELDAPNSNLGGRPRTPPPVPETGSTKLINLAFERIQILQQLSTSGANSASLRITEIKPDVFAQLVSQTPAVLIKAPDHSNTTTVLIAVGLLVGGVLLAGSAFLLGRRRGVQAS